MRWVKAVTVIALTGAALRGTADEPPLSIERTIVLKGPAGRLDHLAIDVQSSRLFVANMANNSQDVVDFGTAKLLKQIPEQNHIQGVAFARDLNRI